MSAWHGFPKIDNGCTDFDLPEALRKIGAWAKRMVVSG
jgi:hypothetical protein